MCDINANGPPVGPSSGYSGWVGLLCVCVRRRREPSGGKVQVTTRGNTVGAAEEKIRGEKSRKTSRECESVPRCSSLLREWNGVDAEDKSE